MKKLMTLALFVASSMAFAADESCYLKSSQASDALPMSICLSSSADGLLLSVDGGEFKLTQSFSRKDATGSEEVVVQISVQDDGACTARRESVLVLAGSLATGESFVTPDWCHSANKLVDSVQYQKVK